MVLVGWWMTFPPLVGAQGGVSGHIEDGNHTLTYSLSGVETDEQNEPFDHSGTVVANQVTLSGSASYTIDEGGVTNLSMSASLQAGDQADGASWPPEGVDGRVSGVTIDFPFSLQVDIPPQPDTSDDFFPTTTSEGSEPEPYTFLTFRVASSNCNDSGACDSVSASGTFAVFPLPSKGPTIDWIAVAGGLGAAAAVAAAAAGIFGVGFGSDDPDSQRKLRYVLQVSSDRLTVESAAGTPLEVDVWAVDSTGVASPAVDAKVDAAVSGPFSLGPNSGLGSLHGLITADGQPGSSGTAVITAIAGATTMSTAVALDCTGVHQLVISPVGSTTIEPDPSTGDYRPAVFDISVVGRLGDSALPVECVLTGAEAVPEGLVTLSQSPSPGEAPGVRLTVELATDPASLADPANREVTINLWAEPAGVDDPPTLTGSTSVSLSPPAMLVHWMRSGHPESTDTEITCPAEEGSTIDLEVWLSTTDGTDPPEAEFSHMANVDLSNRQLAPTKAEFSCDPGSKPWQAPASDNRARSRWRVNESLPSSSASALLPPVDTAIRVRAWPAGSVKRGQESVEADSGRLAQGLVPIRLTPPGALCELVEPTESIPADNGEHEITLRVLTQRDRKPWAGKLHIDVKPVEGRAGSNLSTSDFDLTPEANGELTIALRVPSLDYRDQIDFSETLQVSVPGQQGDPWPIGEVAVWLAPALALTLTSSKKGLQWDDIPVEFPAADRVDTVVGWSRCKTTKTKPVDESDDTDINVATISMVRSSDERDRPIVTGKTDKAGRWELRLPGLQHSDDSEPCEMDDGDTPPGGLSEDLEERLDLYERRMSVRLEQAHHPLGSLVGPTHANRLEDWRFTTLQKLATEPEERHDDIAGTIEIAEAIGVYATSFGRLYYDALGDAVDTVGSLLSDLLGVAFTKYNVGSRVGKSLTSSVSSVGKSLEQHVLMPVLSTVRSAMGKLISLLKRLAAKCGLASEAFHEAMKALDELWVSLVGATDIQSMLVHSVDLVINGVKAMANAAYLLILRLAEKLAPAATSMVEQLTAELGAHLEPGWAKYCEDMLKRGIDNSHATSKLAGAGGQAAMAWLDPFPEYAAHSVDKSLGRLDALHVPSDPEARRDHLGDVFGGLSNEAFERQAMAAEADEYVAWFGLIVTAAQIVLIAYIGLWKVAGEVLKRLTGRLNILDYLSSAVSGLTHVVELLMSLSMAHTVATIGTGAVAGASS